MPILLSELVSWVSGPLMAMLGVRLGCFLLLPVAAQCLGAFVGEVSCAGQLGQETSWFYSCCVGAGGGRGACVYIYYFSYNGYDMPGMNHCNVLH